MPSRNSSVPQSALRAVSRAPDNDPWSHAGFTGGQQGRQAQKESSGKAGARFFLRQAELQRADLLGPRALVALAKLEFDFLTFAQGTESFAVLSNNSSVPQSALNAVSGALEIRTQPGDATERPGMVGRSGLTGKTARRARVSELPEGHTLPHPDSADGILGGNLGLWWGV